MAYGKNQRRKYTRREHGLTDYRRRLKLLRGGKPRAVVRVSNTQISCQLVGYEPDGDKVLASATGATIVSDYKWPKGASRKSVPASYLVGLAMAKRALAAGHDSAVLDIGLAASTKGNRVFAALKGMVDGGLDIPHGENIFPDEDRLNGVHISDKIAKSVKASKKAIEGA
ncbi:MAG: 50S ribosomal protein L18 [Candidatus Thalassarchaeaceae archaeon]|jgi:large subunit ribosomal protein L18|nr:50S ribosomal protein L18 [Candidatus Thalassarchaeaceae archaeon]MDP7043684.1 50S ribosomal protein L18 [Candidatus Thalassarchaeaceae archaeon]